MKRICEDGELRAFFGDGAPHHIHEVAGRFNVSTPVAYHELRCLKALVALNKPGLYVLPGIRRPGRNGFFAVGEAVFFSGGNLPLAVESLVAGSKSGASAREIERTVRTNAKAQLLRLVKAGKMSRRKVGGEYRYFSSAPEVRKRQEAACQKESGGREAARRLEQAEEIPLADVLKILLTHIRNPRFSPKGIALSLLRRGVAIRTEQVRAVFEKYDLAKKN
jgi:hypothetical protein